MKKLIVIYNLIIWVILSLLGLIALGKFAQLFVRDFSAGVEIFIPGVLILVCGVLLIEYFFITRVIKYNRILKNSHKNSKK
ncbi:hypothetical protein [Fusobacterium sp.]|uniref:hypothetical protein n=1 Tax=Fusobacterium sp. TaxID=68766 RepID=UPI002902CF36|nr:hypothetical protein [Fusobacterium sp.]MDU1911696.1 hypothetical protein [Fusobacterium sp.]